MSCSSRSRSAGGLSSDDLQPGPNLPYNALTMALSGGQMGKTGTTTIRSCAGCTESFEPRRPWQRYHEPACSARAAQRRYLQKHGFVSTPRAK